MYCIYFVSKYAYNKNRLSKLYYIVNRKSEQNFDMTVIMLHMKKID